MIRFYWNDKLVSCHKTQEEAFEQGLKYLRQHSALPEPGFKRITLRQCSFIDTTEIDWWKHSKILFERFTDWIWYKRYYDSRGVLMDMKRILSEIKGKGYLSLDDITQLTEINPNFLDSFARCYKLTTEEVRVLASEKEITFNMVFEYIEIDYSALAYWLRKSKITP
jgi:hypothetical protein